MLHQLEKLENENRMFVYYVKTESSFKAQRPYTIHINLDKKASSRDELESYLFARMLD